MKEQFESREEEYRREVQTIPYTSTTNQSLSRIPNVPSPLTRFFFPEHRIKRCMKEETDRRSEIGLKEKIKLPKDT